MKTTDQMTVAELRSFLAERNLPTTGTKPELMLRAKMTISSEQPSSGSTPLQSDHDANDPPGVTSGKTDDAAQLQSSPSTALKSYHGDTDPHAGRLMTWFNDTISMVEAWRGA